MALHKMVNGKKIELSAEEEAVVRKEWEENRVKREQVKKEKEARILQLQQNLTSAMEKLKGMGLTQEEIDALRIKVPSMKEDG